MLNNDNNYVATLLCSSSYSTDRVVLLVVDFYNLSVMDGILKRLKIVGRRCILSVMATCHQIVERMRKEYTSM